MPGGWRDTPEGEGPMVRWDVEAEPLPDIPLPNDIATWADPTSPSGFRLNASMIAPTGFESDQRALLDGLDGWSTFGPIWLSFEAPIDTDDLFGRQGGPDNFSAADFQRHAVYLIDMETGIPVPLDLNGGNFLYVTQRPSQYFVNDPRAGESNTLFETVAEDTNGNRVLDPGEDTDFDGVLDFPNTFTGTASAPLDTVDRMMWFYERETDTLYLKAILPLRQNRTYAVVLTDRLVGAESRQSVRSPFPHVHHVAQREALARLPELLAERPEIYGDLADRGWEGVSFAWTFTTQSTTRDLDTIRDGLYGRGPLSRLEAAFPADVMMHPAQGGAPGFECPDPGDQIYRAPKELFDEVLRTVTIEALELSDEQATEVLDSYHALDYVAVAFFDSPHFLGDPDDPDVNKSFRVDYQTGEAEISSEVNSAFILMPKETAEHQQPFPVAFYVHGHGSANAESLPWAGVMLQHGVAVVLMNAQGHGVELDDVLSSVVRNIFAESCLAPVAEGVIAGRARDLNGDGQIDSGANFWTAYMFHTRDVVRQTLVDHMQAIRIFRSFDGERRAGEVTLQHHSWREPQSFDGDFDLDGTPDLAGDFDGDGTPDLGGPDNDYYFTGGSLGGIISGVMGGLEPAVTVTAPIVGAGGVADVAGRTNNSAVLRAVLLRAMGPLVVTVPSGGPDDNTSCPEGELSLRFLVPDLTSEARIEFACLSPASMGAEDVMIVRNLSNGETRCGGAVREAGLFRVPIPADTGDRLVVELYRDGLSRIEFGECHWDGEAPIPDEVVDTWRVGNGRRGDGVCLNCARYQRTAFEVGDPLVAPAPGLGVRRQTPDFRRLLLLAQAATDPADPINYARRVILEPVSAPDVRARTRSLLVVSTVGDNNVPVATANSYARAAGVLPFLPPDAPDVFADWRAPSWFEARYPGMTTPNDVLREYHVLEGVDWLHRHPAGEGAEHFLADVDDLSDGVLRFLPDGTQSEAPEAIGPVRLADEGLPPLRWTRQSRPATSPTDDPFTHVPGEPLSGVVSAYAVPEGTHGFDADTVMNPNVPFDVAQYMVNVIARHAATNGEDLYYVSSPEGHHCLEDSSCDFLTPE